MELPDLQSLTLIQVITTLLFFAFIDTASSMLIAAGNGNFSSAYALDFLRTHILKVAVPIVLMAVVGTGIPPLGIPAVPAAFGAALASLLVYIGVTVASIKDSWDDKGAAPTATSNIAPVVSPPATLSKP